MAVVACGALGADLRAIARRRRLDLEFHCLPPLLHNRPEMIAPEVERLVAALQADGKQVVVAYADCGTYGALDQVCRSLGVARLGGLHCYDVLAGAERIRRLLEEEPGSYLLTDFLVRSFARTVAAELGIDRHPELISDYFGQYRRVLWLTSEPEGGLRAEAEAVAARIRLPLVVVELTGGELEAALDRMLASAAPAEAQPASVEP